MEIEAYADVAGETHLRRVRSPLRRSTHTREFQGEAEPTWTKVSPLPYTEHASKETRSRVARASEMSWSEQAPVGGLSLPLNRKLASIGRLLSAPAAHGELEGYARGPRPCKRDSEHKNDA